MKSEAPALPRRLIYGALAGLVATAPMTAVMHRLHGRLKKKERYPLPPREIIGSVAPVTEDAAATDSTLVAHFAYGALSGAALAAVIEKPTVIRGMSGGVGIWLASYLGWIPAAGILKPATRHPARRNRLMLAAHLVWGSAYAITQRELLKSRKAFDDGRLKDAAT
jgi:hypothetical protein